MTGDVPTIRELIAEPLGLAELRAEQQRLPIRAAQRPRRHRQHSRPGMSPSTTRASNHGVVRRAPHPTAATRR